MRYCDGGLTPFYGVIAEKNFVVEDAMAAFEKLIIYNVFVNRFFDIEEAKLKLSPRSFENIYVLLDRYTKTENNNSLLLGKEVIGKLEELLIDLQEVIKDYSSYYDENILVKNKIDDEELYRLWETLAHMNRLQYLQGTELINKIDVLSEMFDEMEKLGVDKELSNYDLTILKELTKESKNTEKTIKSLDKEKEIVHLPIRDQVEILIEGLKKVAREKLPVYKQDLRYPK
ncbi:hypothetical protein FGG79_20760 [Bacillus sp. BHET2]|nr:hypothetical protein FGG79_20760 [Bacillus sp. BHET2]